MFPLIKVPTFGRQDGRSPPLPQRLLILENFIILMLFTNMLMERNLL